uniref:Uncharacterized protein n=1 Tax=Heterorhabditis bacteriophora TaxID=37862 RepID=A0A1I7W965_HETBA
MIRCYKISSVVKDSFLSVNLTINNYSSQLDIILEVKLTIFLYLVVMYSEFEYILGNLRLVDNEIYVITKNKAICIFYISKQFCIKSIFKEQIAFGMEFLLECYIFVLIANFFDEDGNIYYDRTIKF